MASTALSMVWQDDVVGKRLFTQLFNGVPFRRDAPPNPLVGLIPSFPNNSQGVLMCSDIVACKSTLRSVTATNEL